MIVADALKKLDSLLLNGDSEEFFERWIWNAYVTEEQRGLHAREVGVPAGEALDEQRPKAELF